MELELLVYITIQMLELLVKQRELQSISEETLSKHITVKLFFLKNNLVYLENPEIKIKCDNILNLINKGISKNQIHIN